MILSAVYMLWMFQRVFYGKVTNDHNQAPARPVVPRVGDRRPAVRRGRSCMGVAPNVFLKPMEPAVQRIVERVQARQPMRVDSRAAAPCSWFRSRPTPSAAAARPRADARVEGQR